MKFTSGIHPITPPFILPVLERLIRIRRLLVPLTFRLPLRLLLIMTSIVLAEAT
jgi:hypothetical protein